MHPFVMVGGLAGVTSAVLHWSGHISAPLAPIMVFAAPLPLFLAGLGWGTAAGLIAAAAAVAVLTATSGLMVGLAFGLTTALAPVWLGRLALLRRQLYPNHPERGVEWYPVGNLLAWLAGTAVVGVLLIELAVLVKTGHRTPVSVAALLTEIAPEHSVLRETLLTQTNAKDWSSLASFVGMITPALGGISWQMMIAANGILALFVLNRSRRALRPWPPAQSLTLPRGLFIAVTVAVLLAASGFVDRYWFGTLAALLCVPYFFLGMTVVHAMPIRGPGRFALLGLFYFLLLALLWLPALVCLLGYCEQGFGIRKRFLAGAGGEDG